MQKRDQMTTGYLPVRARATRAIESPGTTRTEEGKTRPRSTGQTARLSQHLRIRGQEEVEASADDVFPPDRWRCGRSSRFVQSPGARESTWFVPGERDGEAKQRSSPARDQKEAEGGMQKKRG